MAKACIFQANKSNIGAKYRKLGCTPHLHLHTPNNISVKHGTRLLENNRKEVFFSWIKLFFFVWEPGIPFLFIVESNYKLLKTGKYDAVDDDTDTNLPDDDHSEDVKKIVKLVNVWYHPGLKKYFDRHPLNEHCCF